MNKIYGLHNGVMMEAKRNTNMVLTALCLGFFMVIIDAMIINVALPMMGKSIAGSLSQLQWVAGGYALTFSCLLLSAGDLGDRVGAKNIFLCGLGGFALASLGCGLAENISVLIIFRLLQGAAAAFLIPPALSLIHNLYQNNYERAKAIGVWASVGGVAGASGPLLGALLTHYFSWRAVFLINIPISLVAIWLTVYYVAALEPRKNAKNFDFLGQLLAIVSIAGLAFALIETGNIGWLAPQVVGAFIIFLLGTIAFLYVEHFASKPLVPLRLFRSPFFSAVMAVGFLMNAGCYGVLFILPFYFQHVRGYSILLSGLALSPLFLWGALASHRSGKLTSKTGPKLPMLIGLLVGTVSLFCLGLVEKQSAAFALLILPLSAFGFSVTFAMPAATVAVMQSVPREKTGLATGLFNAGRQVGSLCGVAVFGTILNASSSFVSGVQICLFGGGLLYLAAAIITVLFVTFRALQETSQKDQ